MLVGLQRVSNRPDKAGPLRLLGRGSQTVASLQQQSMPGLHDVFRASVARNDASGFPPLGHSFSTAGALIESRIENALVNRSLQRTSHPTLNGGPFLPSIERLRFWRVGVKRCCPVVAVSRPHPNPQSTIHQPGQGCGLQLSIAKANTPPKRVNDAPRGIASSRGSAVVESRFAGTNCFSELPRQSPK
jgi:hypothetical protein